MSSGGSPQDGKFFPNVKSPRSGPVSDQGHPHQRTKTVLPLFPPSPSAQYCTISRKCTNGPAVAKHSALLPKSSNRESTARRRPRPLGRCPLLDPEHSLLVDRILAWIVMYAPGARYRPGKKSSSGFRVIQWASMKFARLAHASDIM